MVLLLIVTLAASFSEAIGLSLLIPLLNAILGIGQHVSGTTQSGLEYLYAFLPSQNKIATILGALIALICLKTFFTILNAYLSANFVWTLNSIWSQKIFDRYLSFSFRKYLQQKHGDLINNLVQEPLTAAEALSRFIAFAVKLCLSVTMYAFLLALDWKITTFLTGLVLLVIFPLNHLLRRRAHNLGHTRLSLSQKLSSCATESIAGLKLFKAFGLETSMSKYFGEINRELNTTRVRGQVITAFITPSVELAIIIILVSLIYEMTGFNSDRLINVLPQLTAIIVIANRLMSYFSEMLSFRVSLNYVMPSLFLVHELASGKEEGEDIVNGNTFDKLESDIVFDNVSFRYKKDKPLFDNLDITLPRGKIVTFIGPSGVGKSTIAALLLGLYTPDGGAIRINGHPLTEYSLRSWRAAIGYVPQETVLFNLTIRENIRLGKAGATDEEVENAARIAAIHDFVISLTQGYDTMVGECGCQLSGGQRQRISIARAVVRNPEIYIFDEATSALDAETEIITQSLLEENFSGKSVIIITHRTSTAKRSDIVYCIKNGDCMKIPKDHPMLSDATI